MFAYDRRTASEADCVLVENLTGDVQRTKIGRFGLWIAADSMPQYCLWNKRSYKFWENGGATHQNELANYLGNREISPFSKLFVKKKNIDLPPSGFTVAFKKSSKIPSFGVWDGWLKNAFCNGNENFLSKPVIEYSTQHKITPTIKVQRNKVNFGIHILEFYTWL